MAVKYPIPMPNALVVGTGGLPTREWWNYWNNLQQDSGGPDNAELLNDITIISEKLGSPDGTPENIPPRGNSGQVLGTMSIVNNGVLPNVVTLNLVGDIDAPGNTYYYGTDSSGAKSFYTISSALIPSSNVTLTTDAGGQVTFDLSDVTPGTSGRLYGLAFDAKGRLSQQHALDVVGVTDRTTITGGDGSGATIGVDIAATYAGQTSITTLGTITTGTWNGAPIGAPFGGTGQTAVTTGDVLYGSATNTWSRRSIGTSNQVMIVSGGLPTWGQVSLAAGVTGTLPAANGGTGQATYTVGDILYASSTTALSKLPIGSSGQVLGVAAGIPAWQSAGGTGTVTSITAGTGLVATPSNPITTSGTLAIANTITAGTSGDARHVPQITYNAQGQLTSVALKNVCPYDSTGLISGGVLSINAGNAALFDLTAGVMLYEDYTNPSEPEQVLVNFGPFTGVSIPGIATRNATYIGIDNTGAINQFADPLTNAQRRSMAFIGALIHSNLSTINAVNDISSTVRSGGNQVQDLMAAIGPLNISGNVFSANGANLMMNKTAGSLFKFGSNFWTNVLDPHVVSLGAQTALTFRYRMSNGTEGANVTAIDPNTYESPLGTLTAVPALINTWHVQRVNIFQSGLVRVQYGQQVYASQAAAIAGIASDPYITETNIAENGVLRCFLVINRGILNLNTSATFIAVSKFGAASITSAGSVTSVGVGQGLVATPSGPITSTGTISVDIPTSWAFS